ncbi:hypothetical protein RDI58_004000 [Solanum bulbocastanum]|uniref:Uncharacterized protein n=1 Tax=Solanum bulbocastanum TaxID=147425 RepID=A0AAN8YJQ8_SOLBU
MQTGLKSLDSIPTSYEIAQTGGIPNSNAQKETTGEQPMLHPAETKTGKSWTTLFKGA